jgi:hypothetical protein
VLFADQATYFTQPSPPPAPVPSATTNAPAATNIVAAPSAATNRIASPTATLTNLPAARPGFIAELCIAEDADAARRTFGQVVSELKQNALFEKVDSLAGDLRRNLADPQVLLPARHFVLALELAGAELLQPAPAPARGRRSAAAEAPPPRSPAVRPDSNTNFNSRLAP